MSVIETLYNPGSVAVIGASGDPGKVTGRPIAFLQEHGFGGDIYPVNPRYDEIAGLRCYSSIDELPNAPDVGLVLVGANRVSEAVEGLAKIGTKAAIVLASGFGEAGAEGRTRQDALRVAAGDMRILGPNTIGLVNLTDRIMLTPTGAMEMDDYASGPIAVFSQSGGIMGSLLSRASARGIGFSKLVATGNEADLEVADFLAAAADDEATSVVALYLETIRDVDAFRAAALRMQKAGKRIVAYKVGRSEAGAKAAVSHTGALAGATEVYDAFLDQVGVIRAQTFSDLLDIPATLAQGRTLKGNRIAVVTSTGGAATIVADNIGLTDLETPPPDAATAAQLQELDLADAVLDGNPIDVTMAGAKPDILRQILRIVTESASYDAVVTIVGSSSIPNPDLVAVPLAETRALTDKPLLAYVSPDAPHIVKHLNKIGIPAFGSPESCTPALLALQSVPNAEPAAEATALEIDPSRLSSGSLNESDSKALFAKAGIGVPKSAIAADPASAHDQAQGFPGAVVLKILSDEIAHKSEVGGVAVNIAQEDVHARSDQMLKDVGTKTSAKIDGILVEEFVTDGVEMILGFNRDPQLGPYILLGAGGVTTELYQDVALRVLPVTRADVQTMINQLTCSALLTGFRGRPEADAEALIDAVLAFANLAQHLGPHLLEAEINPLFVMPKGEGVHAGDALVIMT